MHSFLIPIEIRVFCALLLRCNGLSIMSFVRFSVFLLIFNFSCAPEYILVNIILSCTHSGCNKKYYTHSSVVSHMLIHEQGAKLTCDFEGCGRKFDELCRLRQHMRSHTGERPYRCSYEGCDWAFYTSSKLCRHLRKHTGLRKWICPHDECGKSFSRPEHVRSHFLTHCNVTPFQCTAAGIKTNEQFN